MNIPTSYVIETQTLSKTYKNIQALKPLDLKVQQNSILGFLGPNGAGKTTTIKLLLGLIRPSGGGANVFGMDCVTRSVDIRARVGYLPQEPHFYEHMTARQTLNFVARFFFRGPKKAIEQRVEEMLELVDLADKADRPIKTFSGGERQRLGIAQAQVNYPDLLILDEPAASLDPIGRRDVLEVMSKLRKHTTVFYSTHILDDVQKVSDTVVILNKGELVAQGPIETLLAGSEGVVYLIHLRGQLEVVYQEVLSLPWVSGIISGQHNGDITWQVSVSDPQAAEAELLKLLVNKPVLVTEFRRKQYELEDIFLQVIEGGQNVRK
ncbi:MAG: ABC transporter ATP-binding protein [Anaerolineales bacterium]|nr:MAG: ABC transporter ATP-binding protein [Anaerolineales bacterium]